MTETTEYTFEGHYPPVNGALEPSPPGASAAVEHTNDQNHRQGHGADAGCSSSSDKLRCGDVSDKLQSGDVQLGGASHSQQSLLNGTVRHERHGNGEESDCQSMHLNGDCQLSSEGQPGKKEISNSIAGHLENHDSANMELAPADSGCTTPPADGTGLCSSASGPAEGTSEQSWSMAPVDVAVGAACCDAVVTGDVALNTDAMKNPPDIVTSTTQPPRKMSVLDIDEDDMDDVSLSALRWDPPPEKPCFNLSFAGCGFLGIYHLGVASSLIHHGRSFLENVECFGGASAGALVASVLAVRGVDKEALEAGLKFTRDTAISVHKRRLGMLTPRFSVLEPLEEFLRSIMPEDAHHIASGRLYLSMTRLKNRRNVLVSEFENNDELIKCMLASSYVPMVTGKRPIKIKGKKYIDGGMTVNLPVLPGPRTILVSPFSGGQDIAPIDKTKKAVQLNGQDFHVSRQNMVRGYHAFFPPPMDHLEDYYKKGERDAVRFLQKEGLYENGSIRTDKI